MTGKPSRTDIGLAREMRGLLVVSMTARNTSDLEGPALGAKSDVERLAEGLPVVEPMFDTRMVHSFRGSVDALTSAARAVSNDEVRPTPPHIRLWTRSGDIFAA